MAASDGFAEFLREQLARLGRLTMRRIFDNTGVSALELRLTFQIFPPAASRISAEARALEEPSPRCPISQKGTFCGLSA